MQVLLQSHSQLPAELLTSPLPGNKWSLPPREQSVEPCRNPSASVGQHKVRGPCGFPIQDDHDPPWLLPVYMLCSHLFILGKLNRSVNTHCGQTPARGQAGRGTCGLDLPAQSSSWGRTPRALCMQKLGPHSLTGLPPRQHAGNDSGS